MSETGFNYFNYFTEIEEHFQRARATSLFLLSPLDWALIETWKNSNVPLEAVLRGIDIAFEKWRAKRNRSQMVNSLAFCAQAVMVEAQRMADGASSAASRKTESETFPKDSIRDYLIANAATIESAQIADFIAVAESLKTLAAAVPDDLETLEQQLTVLEQKLLALARVRQSDQQAMAARQSLDNYLRPYRGKMTAPQLAMLEAQFLDRSVLEAFGLPRLSLFHLR